MYKAALLHDPIHPAYNLFLAIYLAYLLADFVFQTSRIVSNKHRGNWRGYIIHGVTHYVAVLVIVTLADPHRLPTLSFQLIAGSLSLVHLLVDRAKVSFTASHRMPDNAVAFVLDQAIHLVTVIVAVFLLVHPSLDTLVLWLNRIRSHEESILLVSVIYVLVIFGGGYFIRTLIGPLWKEEAGQTTKEHEEVINAGLYIGWLERFLVLTALFLQSPATVGFILAAKSIARYPELKSVRFAEYFLIGTLLSVAIAIGGAIILLKTLYGAVVLGK
jgi:glucan phosphoethanolaminetransferase (alkaline phosphatase superfamily)